VAAPPPTREEALAAVLARRERASARPVTLRAAAVLGGFALLLVALPLIVLLPEAGVPVVLVALRLLATEFDWAARAYAWVTWQWGRFRSWFARQSAAVRWLLVGALVAVAAALVWLVVAH
jgi:hypothetical protein